MSGENIPIEGDDEAPPDDFHMPEPEEFEGIFDWLKKKAVKAAGDAVDVVGEGVEVAADYAETLRQILDDNPEVEVATEFAIGSMLNRYLMRRMADRLQETDADFRKDFVKMVKKSLKDDQEIIDADFEVVDD